MPASSIWAILAVCAATACTSATAPASAPAAPSAPPATDYSTWGHETIALPPAFAPDMQGEGEERLLFAPGMFTRGAPDYFAYAMVLDYPTSADVPTAQVVTLITQYYRGLMTAVAEGKGFDVHAAGVIDVAVAAETATTLTLTVQTFDAFVTGAPMALTMRIERQATGAGTCLLAQIAPSAAGDDVWELLAGAATNLSCRGR